MARNETFAIRDRRPGFLRVYNDLYDSYGAKLGPYGLAVYVALCRYANQDSEAWPSYSTIARGTGMSRRQVIREIAKMEALGVIAIERNQNHANTFILLDTSDSQSPPPSDSQSPPSDSQSPKQNTKNKRVRHRNMNKKEAEPTTAEARKRAYIPDEYADIILGGSHSQKTDLDDTGGNGRP